jgi:hypothetical protein
MESGQLEIVRDCVYGMHSHNRRYSIQMGRHVVAPPSQELDGLLYWMIHLDTNLSELVRFVKGKNF